MCAHGEGAERVRERENPKMALSCQSEAPLEGQSHKL